MKKILSISLILILLTVGSNLSLFAFNDVKETMQTAHTVSGVILDEEGEPLIGVSVVEVGTQNGAMTDYDGKFTLKVSNPNSSLQVSYMGYETIKESINGRTSIKLVMKVNTELLEEVVVVAYGTQRKNTVSGSLSTVRADNIKATAPNVTAMLQGQVAGMNVSMNSGKPGEGGTITIRGKGSLNSTTTPLWVVDGVVGGLTASLNPNDIETLTVLKDGSATALYGARGANGVIVVTTKSAKNGENRIDATIKVGFTNLSRGNFKMMNSTELYDYTTQIFDNAKATGVEMYPWITPALKDNDTDWFDLATGTGLTTNYNLAYRTGTDKMRSFLSADYYNEEGAVKDFDYERFTIRNNMTYKFNDKLNLKTSITGHYSNTRDQQRSLYAAGTYLPWDTPYDSSGNIKTGKEGQGIETGKPMSDYWFGRDASNYLYDNQLNSGKSKSFGVDVSVGFDYTIIDGLVFESTNNFGYSSSNSSSYTDPKSMGGAANGGAIWNHDSYNRKRYTNQLLRYDRTFNTIHQVIAFIGHEYSDSWYKFNEQTGKGIPQGGSVPGVASEMEKFKGDEYFQDKIEGYYFNGNYTYDNRYFGQVSFRRDGSTKFGKDNRYGNFWTVGGGWNIDQESFLNSPIIDQLRVRASYGQTGNTPGGNFLSLYLYDLDREYDKRPGAFPKQMGNAKMSWETAKSTNIGADVRLFSRLGATVEFYIKNTSGLLYSRNLSTLSGYDRVWLNEGQLKNTGVEITLSPEIIKTKDWNWTIDFNLGYNKNEVKSLADGKNAEISGKYIHEVGYPMGTYYMREWGGVDEMTGNPTWIHTDKDGNNTYVMSEDQANQKNLDKKRFPDFTGGINTHVGYKDFTLSATFAFASGFYIYHYGREQYDNDGAEVQYNSMKLKKGWSRWEKPGDKATHPRPLPGGNMNAFKESSRYLERGDFFKMKTLAVSYNVPKSLLSKMGVHSAQLSFSADNLFTITEFSGIDPEMSVNGNSYDASTYPLAKKYMFSLALGF